MTFWFGFFVLCWIVVSLCIFVSYLDQETKPDRWWIYAFYPPIIATSFVLGCFIPERVDNEE